MDVWTLELRPDAREGSAFAAWLAALVVFRTLKSLRFFQVLVNFFIPCKEILTGLFIYQPSFSNYFLIMRSVSLIYKLSEFMRVTMVITDYMLRYHTGELESITEDSNRCRVNAIVRVRTLANCSPLSWHHQFLGQKSCPDREQCIYTVDNP